MGSQLFYSLLFAAALLSPEALSYCGECSLPYVKLATGCYYFSGSTTINWWEAAEKCKSLDGVLAVIDSDLENEAIRHYLIQSSATDSFAGGYDMGHEGLWYWESSRKPIQFSDWAPGQPDNAWEGQNCVQFYKANDFHWNDNGCDTLGSFICEAASPKGEDKECNCNCTAASGPGKNKNCGRCRC